MYDFRTFICCVVAILFTSIYPTCDVYEVHLTIALLAGLCTASKGVQCCRTAHSIQSRILAEILCWRWMYMASMFVRKETGCCVEEGVSWYCAASLRVLRPKELGLVHVGRRLWMSWKEDAVAQVTICTKKKNTDNCVPAVIFMGSNYSIQL